MNNSYYYGMYKDGDRIFWVPFLLGGLGGAAVVGLSRPRPVYVNGQVPNYNQMPYPYPAPRPPYYGGGYGYSNYNYYY